MFEKNVCLCWVLRGAPADAEGTHRSGDEQGTVLAGSRQPSLQCSELVERKGSWGIQLWNFCKPFLEQTVIILNHISHFTYLAPFRGIFTKAGGLDTTHPAHFNYLLQWFHKIAKTIHIFMPYSQKLLLSVNIFTYTANINLPGSVRMLLMLHFSPNRRRKRLQTKQKGRKGHTIGSIRQAAWITGSISRTACSRMLMGLSKDTAVSKSSPKREGTAKRRNLEILTNYSYLDNA